MIINHNLSAMNAQRQMGINQTNATKSMEKLSSGLNINRAGDDAAGLAISEKMRGQIRGLDQANRNAQDGISLIQTAEGALNETHSILQRMRELAVQASNDTNVDVDREAIQNEIKQLKSEIDRIGNTTEFNTQSLLKGDGSSSLDKTGIVSKTHLAGGDVETHDAKQEIQAKAAATKGDTVTLTLNGEEITITFAGETDNGKSGGNVYEVTGNSATVNVANSASEETTAKGIADALEKIIAANEKLAGNYTVKNTTDKTTITATGDFVGANGFIGKATGTGSSTGLVGADSIGTTTQVKANTEIDLSSVTDVKDLIGKGITINGQKIEFYNANDGAYTGNNIGVNISDVIAGTGTEAEELVATIVEQISDKLSGVTLSVGTGNNKLKVEAKEGGVSGNDISISDGGVQENFTASFQIGANQNQTMEISIADMRADALGVKDIDLSTRTGAEAAVTTINDAIEKVSTQRSVLGAFQNRLEHTINNLGTSSENLTAAESRIRDVDMAKEMMEMSKNNILQQASQAMLAQANQTPQQVLQLLR